jgi:hypothetical protein
MQKRIYIAVLSIFLGLTALTAKEKDRTWQTGKLISAEQKETGVVAVPMGGIVVAKNLKSWFYTIETETTVYELRWKSPEPINLTVNGTVKLQSRKTTQRSSLTRTAKNANWH